MVDVLVDVLGLVAHPKTEVLYSVQHPGMLEDGLKADPVSGSDPQTGEDQSLTLLGQVRYSEPQICRTDLLVCLEGDVATNQVVEEDAMGPDAGGLGVVHSGGEYTYTRVPSKLM